MSVDLSAFPEITGWQPRCRMCKLIRDAPGLARVVHDVYRDSMDGDARASAERVADATGARMERQGVRAFDAQVIRRHFDRHVDCGAFPEKIDATFAAASASARSADDHLGRDADALRALDPNIGALGQGDNDYFRMWELFSKLLRRVAALDKDPTAFWTEAGGHDMYKLNVWTGMIRTAGSVLNDLNKMRNNDKLVVSMLTKQTEKLASMLATQLGGELRTVLKLLDEGRHEDAKAELGDIMRVRIPAAFTAAAETSLEEVKTQYGLH